MNTNIKVFVPKTVSDKVKYLCNKINTVEWCALTFYQMEGSITTPEEVKITMKDILPISKDSAGRTGYKESDSDKIIDYLCNDDENNTRARYLQGDMH